MAEKFWNVVSLKGSADSIRSLRNFICSMSGFSVSLFDFEVFSPVPSSLRVPYSPTTFLSYYAYKATIGDTVYDHYVYWGRYLYRLYLKDKDSFGQDVTDYPSFVRYCDRFHRFGVRILSGRQVFDNISVYGFGTAVEWMHRHWGVLSNSYGCEEISPSKFAFAVDGGVPDMMFLRLSQKFPEVLITARYAGDYPGKHCGVLQFLSGRLCHMEEFGSSQSVMQGKKLRPDHEYWRSVIGCRGVPAGSLSGGS